MQEDTFCDNVEDKADSSHRDGGLDNIVSGISTAKHGCITQSEQYANIFRRLKDTRRGIVAASFVQSGSIHSPFLQADQKVM